MYLWFTYLWSSNSPIVNIFEKAFYIYWSFFVSLQFPQIPPASLPIQLYVLSLFLFKTNKTIHIQREKKKNTVMKIKINK